MARRRRAFLKKHELQIVKRKRTCKNSGNAIAKGETCLVLWDSQFDQHTYSRGVALDMIADARTRLDELEEAL